MGHYSWGSNLMPWEIAWNGQLWLEEHLTMTDVREGFRFVRLPPCQSLLESATSCHLLCQRRHRKAAGPRASSFAWVFM